MISFFKKTAKTRAIFFVTADAFLIALSAWLAFIIRFEGAVPEKYFLNIIAIIFLAWLITIPVFYFFRLYHFTWAYVSTEELASLIKGIIFSFLILTGIFFVLQNQLIFSGFPRSTLFISYSLIFFLCGGLRLAKRIYLELFPEKKTGKKEKTLIVGAGDGGEQILRSILASRNSPYLPVGFVDDSPAKQGNIIHGVKVLGKISDIPQIAKKEGVEGLIVAFASAGSRAIRGAVEKGRKAGLRKIKIVPPLDELIDGRISLANLKDIEMEDLLGRDPVALEPKLIEDFVGGKKILVTGAAGSIGSELCRQIAKFQPAKLFLLDQDETGIFNISEELKEKFPKLNSFSLIADIGDKLKIEKIFEEFRPDIVFHAAAYKHVPLMENNPDEAVKNNIFGTKIVAEAALSNKTERFIMISTDKAVNPSSVMGATKRTAEMICQALDQKATTEFISVRFGNVLDSRGSVIPIFREKIRKREPIEVTHAEMKRFFMTTPESCLLVLQAGASGKRGEVLVLDMGDPIKIMDLAKQMIKLSGLEPDKDIPIVFTEPRPGEKMFEELLTAEEGTVATQNKKIFMAKLSPVDKDKLSFSLKKLEKAVYNRDKEIIIKTLEEFIPNYKNGKKIQEKKGKIG